MVQVSVATINLRGRQDRWPERRQLLVTQLVEATPDLISLQEISMPIRQGPWLRKALNQHISGSANEPYRLVQKRKHHLINGYYEGVGVLSRLPILYFVTLNLGYGGRVALRVHVELPSHKTMDFVATHLHHVPFEKEAREEQTMQLSAWLRSHKHVPLQVIAGDFNELPDGLAIQIMKQTFRSAYAEVNGRDPLATFPTALVGGNTPSACLDYIFVSGAIQKVAAARIFCDKPDLEDETLYPSDHVGLLAILEI